MINYKEKTWFYSVNPSIKFITIILLGFISLFIQSIYTLVTISIFLTILYFKYANLSFKWRCKIFLFVLFLSLLSGISIFLFGYGENIIFKFLWWKISYESIYAGLIVVFKTLVMSMLGLIFSTTSSPTLFCYSLMQQLKLSPNIAYAFLVAMRILPLLIEDFEQLF